MAAKKRNASRRRAPAAPALQHIDVTFRNSPIEWVKSKIPLLLFVGALGTAIGVLGSWWSSLGLPKLVIDRELHETLDRLKGEVQTNIGTTKNEVISHTNKTTGEVKLEVDALKKDVGVVGKDVRQSMLLGLETATRSWFTQIAQQKTTLGNIEMQLRERPNDSYLITRKAEVESLIRAFEIEYANAQEQLRRMRN